MNNRGKIIFGNWKLSGSKPLMEQTLQMLGQTLSSFDTEQVLSLAVCAPATDVGETIRLAAEASEFIHIGCKNINTDPHIFTSELTATAAKQLGCKFCLVGYSERHSPLNEGDYSYRLKVEQLLDVGIAPILCVGDSQEDYLAGKSFDVIFQQLHQALAPVREKLIRMQSLYVVYEPAYNSSQHQTSAHLFAQSVHADIRKMLVEILEPDSAHNASIIFGGNINHDNALDLITQPDVDGLLIACANSNIHHFQTICNHVITQGSVFNYVTEHNDNEALHARV